MTKLIFVYIGLLFVYAGIMCGSLALWVYFIKWAVQL